MTSDKSESESNKRVPDDQPFETPEDEPTAKSENTDKEPEWLDVLGSGSLYKKIIKEGEPNTRPQRLQKCLLNYELTLEDGTVVEKKTDFEIQLGDCEVVQGLDLAIGLMDVTERSILKIQPRLAYGSIGLSPTIPPNTTVIYDIELVSVVDEEDPEALSIQERKIQGNKKRERGNWWYGRGENTVAIQCYRRALDFLDEVEGGVSEPADQESDDVTDRALQDLLEDRLSVCNNMAAAQIKLEMYEAALNSLQTVLRCQPNNVKALFRKAKVHKGKNDLLAALKSLKKADEVNPNDADIQKEIAIISKMVQKQKVTERELAKRMFGEKAPLDKEKGSSYSGNKMLVWTATAAASFAVGLAGLAAYRLKFA